MWVYHEELITGWNYVWFFSIDICWNNRVWTKHFMKVVVIDFFSLNTFTYWADVICMWVYYDELQIEFRFGYDLLIFIETTGFILWTIWHFLWNFFSKQLNMIWFLVCVPILDDLQIKFTFGSDPLIYT